MAYMHVVSDESLCLVQELLVSSLSHVDEGILISADHFNCTSQYGFDSEGSARIEILNDSSVAVENDEKILLHGLVENVDEQRGSLTFFCQIQWGVNTKTRKSADKNRECLRSMVVDFTKDSQGFFSAAFALTFKNQENGQVIGHGTGYLLFEKPRISLQ
ncbi:MAG TPA: hypothetical protein EYG88_04535 [Desulfocapsa sulfexigens]|nr:hypothetical protein [Desulfocapsa sulfexigens]